MFSSAFKSFSSNILSNYEISKQPIANVGVWTIFDAKKKNSGTAVSVFTFDRKSLDVSSTGLSGRTSATSLRKVQDEVVERLRKEASSLARLRHPSVLQLVEPVEDTRSGGLMFATEPVIGSLSGVLAQKDTGSASVRNESGSRVRQEIELDDLEVQKGLLQIAKGLEFLHTSAKLVHGNLTPNAIIINVKSDWKLSGLAFAGPPDGAEGHQAVPQISLSEVLHLDARIPRSVQLDLDYTSPDFVLDSNVGFSADIFSLGLVLLACYRTPHVSPVETHGSQSTYKKIMSSSSTAPSPSNNFLCSATLPQELQQVLPRILTRRPAQRMNASEFQQSEYFDNILVNTMRFLDGLPAKTPAEKAQFMRGLGRVMPQFPKSVLGKKIMSTLLDELKDKELLSVILQNIFQILKIIPDKEEVLSIKVLPRLNQIFLAKSKSEERDTTREAGLVIFLENIKLISGNCTAKQFKDEALPIIHTAMESSTHSLVDAALSSLSTVLPILDFSTVKHDLFPVVASVFSKTSSLGIKVRGLEALGVLCGAGEEVVPRRNDDLAGVAVQEQSNRHLSSLDKFTMQEKIVPLLKGIRTKEPAVMMAALKVFQRITVAGDTDFLAIEVMPILWTFALGPLLDLQQFKSYMGTIRSLSDKIEREQIRKLQDLSSSGKPADARSGVASPVSNNHRGSANGAHNVEDDFEKLVLGGRTQPQNDVFAGVLSDGEKLTQNPPSFSWSSPINNNPRPGNAVRTQSTLSAQNLQPTSRSITPDVPMSSFPSLQPATNSVASGSTAWSPPLSATSSGGRSQATSFLTSPMMTTAPVSASANPWTSPPSNVLTPSPSTNFMPMIAPPPQHRPMQPNYNINANTNATLHQRPGITVQPTAPQATLPQTQQKTGLDKYQSLL